MNELNQFAILIVLFFSLGYFFITIEHFTNINKTSIAILMAIICWTIQFADPSFSGQEKIGFLGEHLIGVSQIIFFLLGALTIVETINAHQGFRIITDLITVRSKRILLWIIGFLTFFLSAILDNLTTTIVMVSLIQKLIDDPKDRLLIGGGIVIAANAGGAWTPIGDVTTTMLWIGGQISAFETMRQLLVPSLICMICSFLIINFMLHGDFERKKMHIKEQWIEPKGRLIFFLGIGLLIFVPIFKSITNLPPYMGILFAVSILWIVTDIIHQKFPDREHLKLPYVLTKIDISGILFFLGILLAVDSLESANVLKKLAVWLNQNIANTTLIATLIGIISAVIDNVPLVAATMGMYEDLSQYPTDSPFWQLIAYCAGTGGSLLIIGSAAGVVFMGLEEVDFFWYIKKISLAALVGYFAGIGIYLII